MCNVHLYTSVHSLYSYSLYRIVVVITFIFELFSFHKN